MTNTLLQFNAESEKKRIVDFLKKTFAEQHIDKAVLGLSGGIDSSVSFFLLKEVLPPENIFVAHLYYSDSSFEHINKAVRDSGIPEKNVSLLSIRNVVDDLGDLLQVGYDESDRVRRGNIAARIRMLVLFDLAKRHSALVCGTENRSENLLGYFTRFGDQASDIEPIAHLYKTQVFELAKYLGVSEAIILQKPTAGLWIGQTDEGEMGFTYAEADQVLSLYFDEKLSLEAIQAKGFLNTEKIIAHTKQNHFKHETPYKL
jgi:NAD+ synthase